MAFQYLLPYRRDSTRVNQVHSTWSRVAILLTRVGASHSWAQRLASASGFLQTRYERKDYMRLLLSNSWFSRFVTEDSMSYHFRLCHFRALLRNAPTHMLDSSITIDKPGCSARVREGLWVLNWVFVPIRVIWSLNFSQFNYALPQPSGAVCLQRP